MTVPATNLPAALLLIALGASSAAQSPINLFNGTSLTGWTQRGAWTATAGTIESNSNGARHLLTAVPFGDFSLQFEYSESTLIGAKLRIWADRDNAGGFLIDLDGNGSPAGVGGIEGSGSSSIASATGGWHRVQVEASNGQLTVKLDGSRTASTGGLGSRAGYLGFEASGTGTLQVRNVKLTPLNLTSSFDGTDLNGWKSVARGPQSGGGVGHVVEKTFTLGLGGGSTKPHAAKWLVQGGLMHGEDGPGGLESTTPIEDAILQISASTKGAAKSDNFTALAMRGTPGQLSGGYDVGIGPYAGEIDPLNKHTPKNTSGLVEETIVVAGRTIAVWINGNLSGIYTDSRAESANVAQGARTGAGSMTLLLPNKDVQVDVKSLAYAGLPKAYGLSAKSQPAAPPPVSAAASSGPSQSGGASATENALLQQQQLQAKQAAADQANRQKSASLMSQALTTSDPQKQMSLYGQVVQIDPTNTAAVQNYKEAQTKLQTQQDAQQKSAVDQVDQQRTQQSREAQTTSALARAQGSFLAGHLAEASSSLNVAERLAPDNPLVRDLRNRINGASALRSRLFMLGGGAGLLSTAALLTFWLRRRRQQRYPLLEITRGLDAGVEFPLDKDVVRIGAVAQDGGQKNDLVIRDVEHAVSRFHCEIAKKNGHLFVTDLRSSNGTKVNGTALQPGVPVRISSRGRILLAGSVELRLGFARRPKARN